ncbi:NAD-dependent epimerase/dehydratase family protein [Candidatus Gottesmanbacteria bacterium]|nr:NAD-dependent epimerase/dehydratase family protein [Candidatus Gottesmanbacteria bacterium]
MSNKSYLVTGGYGLIGSTLVNSLSDKVTVLTRSDKHKDRITNKNVTSIKKSLNNLEKKDLEGINVIYHFASTVDNYNVLSDPYIDVETNIHGTIRLLEICKDLPIKPLIIYPSTFFVYGNEYDKTKTPINEESKTNPLALYPATKLCTESVISLYNKLYDIPYIITRLTNVYGEKEEYNNKKKGGLNYLIMQAVKGEEIHIYKGGNFIRDYIHVDDVVRALRFLEQKNLHETYLVGYGKPVLFRSIIDYLLKITGNKSKVVEIDPPRFHTIVGINNFEADTSKIQKLCWTASIDYKEGIDRIVKAYSTL